MAFIKLKTKSNRVRMVTAEQGAAIWRVFNGEEKGTAKQRQFCKLIERIYLNRDNAPESYLNSYPANDAAPVTDTGYRLPYKD